ncbi:MAG TPA: hypothetical protein VGQ42_03705 [Candidatus Dormibacteraeota bacterium]|jgi:hypothetical protein|nr:hypothetical protein [Candidatus Dormibacteraeota bacterium]
MQPLPAEFLDALRVEEEVLATSRDAVAGRQGTVPVWFAVGPPGVVYLFSLAFSRKVERWRRDPWVRLTAPSSGVTTEGVVHVVRLDELDGVAPLVVDRWDMAGATTPEALHRLVAEGSHVLLRVERGRGPGTEASGGQP